MDSRSDQLESVVEADHEAPSVIELGSVVEVTNGSRDDDTADMKRWYS